MAPANSVTKILAPLLLTNDVPLRAIAIVGEAVTADARLSDIGAGKKVRGNLDEIIELTTAYEALQERAKLAVSEYADHHNERQIIEHLSDIRA